MYELNILYSLLNRDNYSVYRNYIKQEELSKEMRPLMAALDLWFKNNTENCTVDNLCNIFFSLNPENKDYYKEVFNNLQYKKELDSTKILLESFKRQRLLEELSSVAYEASLGKKSPESVLKITDQLKSPVIEDDYTFVTNNLEEIIEQAVKTPGLKWRLKSLNQMFGSLRKGDFGFIFARPETGKTTFLASEITYMAEQLGPEDGPILWFNLEEGGEKVMFRLFQAALGKTKAEILADVPAAQAAYLTITHDKIRIYDDATTHHKLVERMCEKYNPSLVVIDQLDKLYGFQDDREDLRLGKIYVWARELAKRFCPVVGVCQASGEAEGREFLTMAEVSNSKTSKTAEADWILGIGAKHDQGHEGIRGLAALKNKLLGDDETDPAISHGKRQVLIRPAIQRYIDIG